MRAAEPLTVLVATADTGHAWTVRVDESSTEAIPGAVGEADTTLGGSAVQRYLGLWNRGDEITVRGREDVLPLWRERVRVRWR